MLRRGALRLQELACSCSHAASSSALPAALMAQLAPAPQQPSLTEAWQLAVWRSAHQAAARRKELRSGGTVNLGKATLRATVVQYPQAIQYYAPRKTYVYDLNGAIVDRIELPGDVFGHPVRRDILQRVVRWQMARRQQGTHSTKTRAEVRGGGRKPHPQKGLGRARAGSIRAPQWRGGGVAHGPKPRSHAHTLPKKVRRLGLKSALSAKAHEGRLLLVDSLAPEVPKTKLLASKLEGLLAGQPRRSCLLVDSAKEGHDGGAWLRRAAGNLAGVEVVPQIGTNVYSILKRDVLVMTVPAAEALIARLRAPINRLGAAGRAYAARMAAKRAAQPPQA